MSAFTHNLVDRVTHILKDPASCVILIFIVVNILLPHGAGGNEASRLATMAAMTKEYTFSIDHFFWTQDWSLSPNGHYYSNKAPGPAFLGAPLYWLLDRLPLHIVAAIPPNTVHTPDNIFFPSGYIVAIILQVLSMAVLMTLVIRYLQKNKASVAARSFTVAAMAFGTTAALLMNTYFGHAMAAMFIVAAVISLLYKKHFFVGFFLGWALLCDYGVVAAVPFILLVPALYYKKWSPLVLTIIGGIIPGIFWTWYHWLSFGSPFVIAQKYINPVFADTGSHWGTLTWIPNPVTLYWEVLSPERSLLVTQPWILFLCILVFFLPWKTVRRESSLLPLLIYTLIPSFIFLILLGGTLTNWGDDWSPGPRYLSSVLPALAIIAGLSYDSFSRWSRLILWGLLSISLVYAGLVFATTILIPPMSVWLYLRSILSTNQFPLTSLRLYLLMATTVFITVIHVLARIPSHKHQHVT